jgi:hypothetical protein
VKAKLRDYGPFALQVVVAGLLIVAGTLTSSRIASVIDAALAGTLLGASAFLLGRRSAYKAIERSMGWIPKNVSISENDAGVKVALVEQQSGDVVSIEIPEEIESGEQALYFILGELSPRKGEN